MYARKIMIRTCKNCDTKLHSPEESELFCSFDCIKADINRRAKEATDSDQSHTKKLG